MPRAPYADIRHIRHKIRIRRLLFLTAILFVACLLAQTAIAAFIENEFYKISEKSIIKRVKVGEFREFTIVISNYKPSKASVSVSTAGNISNHTTLSKNKLDIAPTSDQNITLTFLADSIGKYNGTIAISGEINEQIPMEIIVSDTSILPVNALSLTVELQNEKVEAGKKLKYKVDLQNFLSERGYEVNLYYSIDRIGGENTYLQNKSFFQESESIKLDNSLSTFKELEIPSFLRQGEYVLNVKADYLGFSVYTSSRFHVTESALDYMLFGVVPLKTATLAVFAAGLAGGGIVFYKKRLQKKKKYASKLNLSLLPKQSVRSTYIGKIAERNVKAYMDLDQMQTHTIVAGSTGGGKTVSVKVIIEEALLKGVSVIVFDPTAQWTGMLRRNQDKKMFAMYEDFGLKKTDARAFSGNIRALTNAREIVEIKKFMKPGEITIFTVHRLEPQDIDVIVSNTTREVFKSNLPESKELKLLIVFDEVHRLLPKFGGTGQGFLQIERGAREFRKWGVGLVLISQVLTDFLGEIKANINTEIQMRTRDQGDLDRIKNKYGSYMLQSLLKASTGTGMLQNSSYNNGDPYFISFRPLLHEHARLSDDELANYAKYNSILDDLDFQIEQLEKLSVDVFDMKLELKMASDKVKAGSFNMAEIYFESLVPRLKNEWDKLGMKPKQREVRFVDEEELQKEFERAKEARKKFEEEAKKKGGSQSPPG